MTNRTTATIVGVLYIIGTVAGVLSLVVAGGMLNAPDYLTKVASHSSQVGLVALLILIMGIVLALVAALMFPILKRWNEALAIGYVIFRGALETFTYLAAALCWLFLVVVAQQSTNAGTAIASQSGSLGAFLVGAQEPLVAVQDIVFSLGALMLYFLLYRAQLIPRWISGWGIVAAVLYLSVGLIYMFFGTQPMILLMPMALQEMVMAVWLIVKGFNTSAIDPGATQRATSAPLGVA